MVAKFSVNVDFNDSYYEKLGLKSNTNYDKALSKAIDHALNDGENIIKREVPRPGHSRSTTGYKPTGNLQRSIHKNKPNPCQGELRTNVPYWVYVQYGTSKMSANPFVTRTARKVQPKLVEYVEEELKRLKVI